MNTVVIKSNNRAEVTQAVHAYANRLRADHPEIRRIIWFGSWVHGYPRPGSDVDLCLVVSQIDIPPRERISNFLPVGFPVGLDLLVYSMDEFERLDQFSPGLKREILRGRDL